MKTTRVPNEIFISELIKLLDIYPYVTFVPKGTSMQPFIRGNRDKVILVKSDQIRKMDILLVKIDGAYIMHRVVAIHGNNITLMGDGNIIGVEHCYKSDVLAKVTTIIRDDKCVDCEGKQHYVLAIIWRFLLPIRRYLLAIYRRLI